MPIVVTRTSLLRPKVETTICESIQEAQNLFDVQVKEDSQRDDGIERTHKIVITPDGGEVFTKG